MSVSMKMDSLICPLPPISAKAMAGYMQTRKEKVRGPGIFFV